MCGVVGIARFDGRPVSADRLRAMTELLAHRGPDGEGFFTDGSVGLGHRRLAIIDPVGSPQPMASADGRAVISFNGEILNYRDLAGGCPTPLRTSGDTEVLVELLARRGLSALDDVRGQYAFALYERAGATVTLARDPIGILPLYYAVEREFVAFASEPKALTPALGHPLQVDERSLDDYLAHGAVPAPNTLFKGVHKVLPGQAITFSANGSRRSTKFWSLPDPLERRPLRAKDAVDELDALMEGAVREALVADVPLGAYLSGGVDSSLIVSYATRLRGAPVTTFSAGFRHDGPDELDVARLASRVIGTDHHEVIVGAEDFPAELARLTWFRDAPISQTSDIAVSALARAASGHVKVVLSGEGSDELFGGYPKHRFARETRWAGVVPTAVRGRGLRLVERAAAGRNERARVALRALAGSNEWERWRGWFAPFSEAERLQMSPIRGYASCCPVDLRGSSLRRALAVDCGPWLADNLLERGDRMTMASSVELRPPFLDRRLVEWAFRAPDDVKVRRGTGKWVVKELARRCLPSELVDRPKVGFFVPVDDWFRGELREFVRDTVLAPGSFVTQVFDRPVVARVVSAHEGGRSDEHKRIWTMLALEIWHGTCISADSGRAVNPAAELERRAQAGVATSTETTGR